MVEPVTTIGAFVVGALVAAANGTATEAAKDAYRWLKAKLAPAAAAEVTQLEAKPDSPARAAVVAEIVDAQPEAEKTELRQLAEALRQALAAEGKTAIVDRSTTMINQFNAYGGQQFNAPGGTQNFGTMPRKPEPDG
jgi:hypothetical protein